MIPLSAYLFGYVEYYFPPQKKKEILNHLLAAKRGALRMDTKEGEGRITILSRDRDVLTPLSYLLPINEGGLFYQFKRLWHRPGLVAGIVCSLLLIILASLTVFRIEVAGNAMLGRDEIEKTLQKAGVSVGSFIPKIDKAAVRTRVLRENPDIAWIGLSLRGTTLFCEVRERKTALRGDTSAGRYNLVASCDAVIEGVSLESGRAAVQIGETVKKGALLVSGIYETADGIVFKSANAVVKGRYTRVFSYSQPLTVMEKVCEKEEIVGFSFAFFQKNVKLFKKNIKNAGKYDIINRKEQVMLFGKLPLPIYYTVESIRPYREEARILTEEEAVLAAYRGLSGEMAAALTNAELVRKQTVGEFTDNAYRVTCCAELIENIAIPLPYGVDAGEG